MDHDPWLVKEVRRITADLRSLQTDISVVEKKYQVQMADADATIVLGNNEWSGFKERVGDACNEITSQLGDFIDNELNRQLHWSALRLLTAAGVLSSELGNYQARLRYVSRHPSETSKDALHLYNWFVARMRPLTSLLSVRLIQLMARVMEPAMWDIQGVLGGGAGGETGEVRLGLRFEPSGDRAREHREREKRLARLRID